MSPGARKKLILVWDVMYVLVILVAWVSFWVRAAQTITGARNRVILIVLGVVGLILNRVAAAMTRKQENLRREAEMERIKGEMMKQSDLGNK